MECKKRLLDLQDSSNIFINKREASKQLKLKANEFLNSRQNANNLVLIIGLLEKRLNEELPVCQCLFTLEVIFCELFKRQEIIIPYTPQKMKYDSPETKYKEWLQDQFEEAIRLILRAMNHENQTDSTQALVTLMKLIALEGKYATINEVNLYHFPIFRLRNILGKLLSQHRSQAFLINRFKEYSDYLDIVYYVWKLLPTLTPKVNCSSDYFALNYLALISAVPVTKELQENQNYLCCDSESANEPFEYSVTRKSINKVWSCVMQWKMNEPIHKQVLIVLLERIMPHLEKPVLLTDFLMDSLDTGGPIGLLALQGVFSLIQKHNITYPNIYEKLYSMFEPEIFHTKFKARLFYLADIFLSSTHLPENMVAAFVKRLSRLSLVAPPQDVMIILQFIGNLILRHPGLKSLLASKTAEKLAQDPYIMDERDPTKSNAIKSSLWEIVLHEKHILPTVATAANFISQPLPSHEWDLSTVLEIKEDDIFDQEISKKTKQYALAFERPHKMFLNRNDKIVQYWKLF